MRLSATQKDVLFILYAVEQQGTVAPVPGMDLFNMVNKARASLVADTNFRTSCHKLHEHNLMNQFRLPSLKLAWNLTDAGRAKAGEIFNNRMNQ